MRIFKIWNTQEMRSFFKNFWLKNIANNISWETKLEQDIDSEENFKGYDKTRSELGKIYDKIAESVNICSKWSQ